MYLQIFSIRDIENLDCTKLDDVQELLLLNRAACDVCFPPSRHLFQKLDCKEKEAVSGGSVLEPKYWEGPESPWQEARCYLPHSQSKDLRQVAEVETDPQAQPSPSTPRVALCSVLHRDDCMAVPAISSEKIAPPQLTSPYAIIYS